MKIFKENLTPNWHANKSNFYNEYNIYLTLKKVLYMLRTTSILWYSSCGHSIDRCIDSEGFFKLSILISKTILSETWEWFTKIIICTL